MSYKLVKRKVPKNTKYIKFNYQDNEDFGMLNLCCWKDEIDKINNVNKIVIDSQSINIYFPMFDFFYVKSYKSKNGFTLRDLIDTIVKTGLQAGKYDTKNNPQHYMSHAGAEDFIGEYAITSTNNRSDIQIEDTNIYVSVQH